MFPLRPLGTSRLLAEHQDEYSALAIRDEAVGGVNQMIRLWEPTPAELATLNRGGAVRLTILGHDHPPVMLNTQEPPESR